MSGDRSNTSIWTDADVYVDWTLTATDPADSFTALAAEWKLAGLLDGAEGFEEERDEDTSEHYAWGGILIKKTRSKHKRTIKFVALEDNETVFRLVNPGSTRGTVGTDGVRVDAIKVPKYESFKIGFELREGNIVKRRVAVAEIESVGTLKDGEEEPSVREITVVLFPQSDGTLYDEITGPAVAPTP
jgi:hypothetical protein